MGDISQSLKRLHSTLNGSQCVLPVGDLWLVRRRRLVTAVEKLRLQKIFPPHDRLTALGDWIPLTHSLAGNAFHSSAGSSSLTISNFQGFNLRQLRLLTWRTA